MFSHANKTLHAYLKHLSRTGEIAGTVHKEPFSTEVIQKLYKKGELAEASTRNPRALMQTAWLFISLYFGKRGRENQAAMKKSILRLVTTAEGAEYFELNRNEPGACACYEESPGRSRLYRRPLKRQDICSSRLLAVPSGGFKSVSASS